MIPQNHPLDSLKTRIYFPHDRVNEIAIFLAIVDQQAQPLSALTGHNWRSAVDGKIFNSRGVHVAIVSGPAIFDATGKKLYDLKGVNIYKLSEELVGHLPDAQNTTRHLPKSTDKLFPQA